MENNNYKESTMVKPCGCRTGCGCGTIPGIENDLPYKGNAALNAQKA